MSYYEDKLAQLNSINDVHGKLKFLESVDFNTKIGGKHDAEIISGMLVSKEGWKEQEKEINTFETQEKGFVWLEEEFWDSYDKCKGHTKKVLGHKTTEIKENIEWVFYAHSIDTIKGKPQLIEQVQKRIPLLRQVIKKGQDENKDEIEIQSILYFDERFDKRYDGYQKDAYAEDFWFYRIITEEGLEYYLLTKSKLPNETCTFSGMKVEMDDFAEVSRSMKIKSLSRLFFVKDYVADVRTIPKEELVEITEKKRVTEQEWKDLLGLHPDGKINRFPNEFEDLRSAFILSGKVDGYPLHLNIWGKTGTKKTMGIIETTAYKFAEDSQICEGGNSRIKALTPSFKEKPANIGYLAKSERVGLVDELGKMVEQESNKHQTQTGNYLGELNFLLEHKPRLVGSGNDNDVRVEATGKYIFVQNPINNKETIGEHVGLIDPTMLSRTLVWVQDYQESEFVMSEKALEVPPTPTQVYPSNTENTEKYICLKMCWGKVSSKLDRNDFLTIFDSCYKFVSQIDENKVGALVKLTSNLIKGNMKDVWKPRAKHHITLLIDGLCKQRCLFRDYDSSFIAKQEDYDLVERILVRMVKGWETNFKLRGWGVGE